MKHIVSIATLFLLFSGVAIAAEEEKAEKSDTEADASAETETKDDEADGEKFPVSGTASLGYRIAAAQFVDAESDAVSYGSQIITFGAGIGYTPIEELALSATMAANKATVETFHRGGTPSTTTLRRTELTNLGLGAGWTGYKIPVVDITVSAGLNASLPTSRAARAAQLVFSIGENVGLSWTKWDLSVSAGFSHAFNLHEEATQQIEDDAVHSDLIKVAGQDLGSPHELHSIEASFGLGYKIIGGWSVAGGYFWTNGFLSTEGKDDEFTSTVVDVQTGTQKGLGVHGTAFSTSYAFSTGTTLNLGMSTVSGVRTSDNSEITVPLFDTQSNINHRTNYTVGLSQAL